MPQVKLFISHRSSDKVLAEAVANLLRHATDLSRDEIRCTSVDGYRLPGGADTASQLRQEVMEAVALVGLITPSAMTSTSVLFELGARWGAGRDLWPALGRGADERNLGGPLGGRNAPHLTSRAKVVQLVEEIAATLDRRVPSWTPLQKDVSEVVTLASDTAEEDASHRQGPRSRTVVLPVKWLALIGGLILVAAAATAWRLNKRNDSTTAEVIRCSAVTQPGLSAGFVSDSSPCSIPRGVTVTGAILDYALDDGGEVSVDDEMVFGVAPTAGTDRGTVALPLNQFRPGRSFILRVTARNAMSPAGDFIDGVSGVARIQISTMRN
jgi:hypothetical protein